MNITKALLTTPVTSYIIISFKIYIAVSVVCTCAMILNTLLKQILIKE